MPEIHVLIFRGTGGVYNESHPYHSEPALVRAGHVGMMGVIANKIIGFHPTVEAADTAGSEKALLDALREHQPQPGTLQDDTAVFERAHTLMPQTRGRTTVYMYPVGISQDTLEQIQKWYNEGQEALYNFPDEDGGFESDQYNCAMFVTVFGIDLPAKTGLIRELVNKMIVNNYQEWDGTVS